MGLVDDQTAKEIEAEVKATDAAVDPHVEPATDINEALNDPSGMVITLARAVGVELQQQQITRRLTGMLGWVEETDAAGNGIPHQYETVMAEVERRLEQWAREHG